MTGNCQVRFLEDGTRVISFCYSTNDEDEKHHIYITNIQKDVLNAKDIAKLYGARWDIELLFKELKSLSLIHISEPTRRTPISYAVFCLKKKKTNISIK